MKVYKQIFSLKLAGFLMINGIPIKRIHHDLKHNHKDVYLFENSKKVEEKIIEYKIKCIKEDI